ncbi:MAG: hypothetical protein NVSMB31_04800 [Vulcanimicrobiaceae bacterium]
MTLSHDPSYNRDVALRRCKRWSAAAAVLLAFLYAGLAGSRASAEPVQYNVGDSAVLNIGIEGGTVLIKTWNRPQVQTDSTTPLVVRAFSSEAVAKNLPRQMLSLSGSVQTARGEITLPEENFALTSVGNQPHEGLFIKGSGGETTITIPQSTALVVTRMGNGKVTLDGYKSGTFFVRLRTGYVHLENMGGEGFVQVMQGPIVVDDSSFNRLRARTAGGNMVFQRTHVRQIEASSIAGSIGFDNGSFEPGLARFETQYGHVALGVGSGNVQIGAHSNSGHILTNFDRHANVDSHLNDTRASLGENGAAVNVSAGGAVFLYDGSIESRGNLGNGWGQFRALITRVANKAGPASHPVIAEPGGRKVLPGRPPRRPRSRGPRPGGF